MPSRRAFLRAGLLSGAGVLAAGCQTKAAPVAAMKIEQPAFPVRARSEKRCVVDQKRQPFLIQGDTPWSLITGLTKSETEEYLQNRADKGRNSLIVNLIEHKFNGPQTHAGLRHFNPLANSLATARSGCSTRAGAKSWTAQVQTAWLS
jgi:hypothetical protein